jgi:hypothetical protein
MTLTSVSGAVKGSYDVVLQSGKAESGTFAAPLCWEGVVGC